MKSIILSLELITPFLTDVINSLLLSLEKGTLSAKQLMQKKFHWNFFHLGKIKIKHVDHNQKTGGGIRRD